MLNRLRPNYAYTCRQCTHHWFRWWIVAWSAPSHYLKQCCKIINLTLRNNIRWYFNRNSNILIQENAFKNVVCEMTSILSRPQCVSICTGIVMWLWATVLGTFLRVIREHRVLTYGSHRLTYKKKIQAYLTDISHIILSMVLVRLVVPGNPWLNKKSLQ